MRIYWEAKDIRAGRRYSKPDVGEAWVIGYLAWRGLGKEKTFVSISLSDGMVLPAVSAAKMARHLTRDRYLPMELTATGCQGPVGTV